jgi:hypothetical protein
MNLSGPILFILIVAVLLAAGAAWLVAWLYQRRMLGGQFWRRVTRTLIARW